MCLHFIASGYFTLMRHAHLQANKAVLTAPAFIVVTYETHVNIIGSLICFQKLYLLYLPLLRLVGNKVL